MITKILVDNSLMSVVAGAEINMTQLGLLAVGQSQTLSRYRKGHNVSGSSNLFQVHVGLVGGVVPIP